MVRRLQKNRRGAAAVEVALVLPLLLLLTLGGIRYGWLFLKAQQITNAARIAARIAIRPDATLADTDAAVASLFSPSKGRITGYTVNYYKTEIDPATDLPLTDADGNPILTAINNFDLEMGIPITVRIIVPCANVDIMNVPLFTKLEPAEGWNLGASATMAKEGF